MKRSMQRSLAAAVGLLALAVVPACHDGNDTTAPRSVPVSERTNSVSPEGYPQITDSYGRLWTLATDRNQLTSSDGTTVDLTAEQTATMANAFYAVINDAPTSIEQTLATNPPPSSPPSTANCTGTPDNPCAASLVPLNTPSLSLSPSAPVAARSAVTGPQHHRGVDPSSIDVATLKRLSAGNSAHGNVLVRRPRRGGLGQNGPHGAAVGPTGLLAPTASAHYLGADTLGTGLSCLDISYNIYTTTATWRTKKAAMLDAVAKLWTSGSTPDKNDVALAYGAAAEFYEKDVQLNVLASWYSLNGCFQNLWPDATTNPASAPTGSNGGAVMIFSCHNEMWEISADGGVTWSPIMVRVCEFVNVI